MSKKIGIIFLISLLFSLMVGYGLYGFGNDFYAAYSQPNLSWGGYRDRLGYMISTFTIFNVHIGVYIVSFILAISSGLILLKFTFSRRPWLLYSTHIIMLHTWPIIMSTSNAMRQGLAMSFIFFAIYYLESKKYIWMVFFSLLTATVHKSGLLFLGVLVLVVMLKYKAFRIFKNIRGLTLLTGLFLFSTFYFLLSKYYAIESDTHIIGKDFRYPFLFINISYIYLYFIYLYKKSSELNLFLLFLSFSFPAFLLHGFNWQYERLNMMIIILYIVSLSSIVKFNQREVSLFLVFFALFFLTVYVGMYSSLSIMSNKI